MENTVIPIYFVDNVGLLDNFEDVKKLRLYFKIIASPIGQFN